MQKILALVAATAMMLVSIGCATYAPMMNSVDVTKIDYSVPMKRGQDCAIMILGFIGPFGQASMVDAIKKAQITKVMALEYSSDSYIVFSRSCVDVWGANSAAPMGALSPSTGQTGG